MLDRFILLSGVVKMCDPCYLNIDNINGKFYRVIDNVKIGVWSIQTEYDDYGKLLVFSMTHTEGVLVREEYDTVYYLDSGMIGVFDNEFSNKKVFKNDYLFYKFCKTVVKDGADCGVMNNLMGCIARCEPSDYYDYTVGLDSNDFVVELTIYFDYESDSSSSELLSSFDDSQSV
jgi:hypothetical protein